MPDTVNNITRIEIPLRAGNAIRLAESILELLTKVGKYQKAEIDDRQFRSLEEVAASDAQLAILLDALNEVLIKEGITIKIIPDLQVPGAPEAERYYTMPVD